MSLEFIDCQQNSPEWHRARMGLPTASEFRTIIGIKKDAKDKLTRQTYLRKLAGEIITGEPAESYTNSHMDRGHAMEDEARGAYAFLHDAVTQRVGFARNGQKGCSPDSLIGNAGMLEIKTKAPHLLIDWLLKDEFPPEHKPQCQGALWVCEREWVDIAGYWPNMPLFTKRAYRDEAYIRELSQAVDDFNHELAEMVAQVRRYGTPAREATCEKCGEPFKQLENYISDPVTRRARHVRKCGKEAA
jgi:hypothetical protein